MRSESPNRFGPSPGIAGLRDLIEAYQADPLQFCLIPANYYTVDWYLSGCDSAWPPRQVPVTDTSDLLDQATYLLAAASYMAQVQSRLAHNDPQISQAFCHQHDSIGVDEADRQSESVQLTGALRSMGELGRIWRAVRSAPTVEDCRLILYRLRALDTTSGNPMGEFFSAVSPSQALLAVELWREQVQHAVGEQARVGTQESPCRESDGFTIQSLARLECHDGNDEEYHRQVRSVRAKLGRRKVHAQDNLHWVQTRDGRVIHKGFWLENPLET